MILKKNYKKFKILNTILESVDTIGIIGAKSTSITLSITGFGLIISTISAGNACALSLHKIIINKYSKKNNMRKINKQMNLSINYTAKVYKII